MRKILLVEDDLILGETLKEVLEEEGFTCKWVKNGEEALDATYAVHFDLLLLDVNVPFINGFELLKSLRDAGDKTPAIFITALVDVSSLSKGFDVGADDYIKKPFDIDELLIRMKALIKRSFNEHKKEIIYSDIIYDIEAQVVKKSNHIVHLPPAEIALLELMLKNIGKVLTKEIINENLSEDGVMSDGALRVHISRLKKLGIIITNLRGVGYRCEKL